MRNRPETHGIRASYLAGCRCLPCRAANAAYAAYSADHPKPVWTSAERSRAHLQALQAHVPAIGKRQAAILSGLSTAHIQRIRNGQQQRVKLSTEQAILAIPTKPAMGQRINSYRARDRRRSLLKEGYTRRTLAFQLRLKDGRVRVRGASVTIKRALQINALFRRLIAEA